MNARYCLAGGLSLVLLAAATAAWQASPARAQDDPVVSKRSQFMRQKLDYAQGIIEGLALEDFPLIAENARKLKVLSQAAEWEVPYIPNVEMYLPYTTEFQRLCDELVLTARDSNVDGATLAYVRLTMNCVNCHKYVRHVTK